MMRFLLLGVAGLALAACEPTVPDSAAGVVDTGRGVGFGDYDSYSAARETALNSGRSVTTVPGPVDVRARVLDGGAGAVADGTAVAQGADEAEVRAAQQAAAANSGIAPLDASPGNPAPQVVSNAAGISGENDFNAVSGQRDIAADAALIARNRAQYTVIQPTDLPTRPGSDTPNIVEYALRTTNPVGVSLYKRSGFNAENRKRRACGAFASADLAQEAFLAMGGPQKDRKGMDPDGDGYACGWNPAPFRAVRGG